MRDRDCSREGRSKASVALGCLCYLVYRIPNARRSKVRQDACDPPRLRQVATSGGNHENAYNRRCTTMLVVGRRHRGRQRNEPSNFA